MKPLDIWIVYNQPGLAATDPDAAAEAGVVAAVEAANGALAAAGHRVRQLPLAGGAQLVSALARGPLPDLAVNFCEGFGGRSQGESQAAAALELSGVAFTGSGSECLALARHKPRAKCLLAEAGVASPPACYLPNDEPLNTSRLKSLAARFPLIVKPALEDASLGIGPESVVRDASALAEQIAAVRSRYGDVLVEQFIAGREFNISIIDLGKARTLPLSEIEFRDSNPAAPRLVTYAAKWSPQSAADLATPARCPALVAPELADELRRLALAAFRALGCRDYARVDVRVDDAGRPYVLEINANPDLSPAAGFATALAADGKSHAQFMVDMANHAWQSRGRDADARRPPARFGERRSPAKHAGTIRMRDLSRADVGPLVQILTACGLFRHEEIAVGREVLEAALEAGPAGDYRVVVAEIDNEPVGWTCHGRVPMTDATFDLYWIAVDPKFQGSGVGRAVLAHVEKLLRGQQARWLLAETSASPAYDATRRFYFGVGYELLSEVPDFYRLGDGRVLFGKRLDG